MTADTLEREEAFARMEEIALRSAYAHGKVLTDFSFALPRQDDVVVLPNGSLALRMDTNDMGYSFEEDALYRALFPSTPSPSLSLPSSFEEHQETIIPSHVMDLEEIARGLIRERVTVTAFFLQTLTQCSLRLHESLLLLVHDLLHIDYPEYAKHLLREAHPVYLHAQDEFLAALLRISHEALQHTATQGAYDQYRQFLETGLATGYEREFFKNQLETLEKGSVCISV